MIKVRVLSSTCILAAAFLTCVAAPARGAEEPANKPPAASQPDQAGVAKFYGTITAVDPKAMTIVIDGQTYHVVAESHVTKASDDKPATIADAVVGEPARGSYTRAADGTMNITKVRFGKKTGGGKSGGKSAGKKKDQAAATQPQQ